MEGAFFRQFDNLCRHAVISLLTAQRLHKEMVPRPFLSSCNEHCMEVGKDLSQGGAKYNVGPVITCIGLAVVANSLAAVKKLVFEDKVCTMDTLVKALQANWEGYEELRAKAQDCPKYGNDDDYVDDIATKVANHYYHEVHQYKDVFGNPFTTAFMGISNYIPMGRVLGATPCGRKNGDPSSEGVSPMSAPTSPRRWPPCVPPPRLTRRYTPAARCSTCAWIPTSSPQARPGQPGRHDTDAVLPGRLPRAVQLHLLRDAADAQKHPETTRTCWCAWPATPPSSSTSPSPCRTPSSPAPEHTGF